MVDDEVVEGAHSNFCPRRLYWRSQRSCLPNWVEVEIVRVDEVRKTHYESRSEKLFPKNTSRNGTVTVSACVAPTGTNENVRFSMGSNTLPARSPNFCENEEPESL